MLSTNVASVKIKAFVAVIFLSVAVLLLLASGVIKNTPSFTSVLIPSPKPPSPYDPITNATLGVCSSPPGGVRGDIADGIQ